MVKELTSFRVVLMLMIFVHHINNSYNGGYSATAAFFVLSGFVMSLAYYHKILSSDFSYTSYITKRLIRIYPLHWICLATIVLVGVIQNSSAISSLRIFALNTLLLQSWYPNQDVYFSFNSPSWYCSALLFFLCLFPFIFKGIRDLSIKKISIIITMLIIIYMLLWTLCPSELRHPVVYVNPAMRLYDSLIGMCLGLITIKVSERPNFISAIQKRSGWLQLIAISGVLLLVILSIFFPLILPKVAISCSLVYWIPVCIAIVALTLLSYANPINPLSKFLSTMPLQWLGKCSFSFYLIHSLVIRYCADTMLLMPKGGNVIVRGFYLFVITLILSQISYYLIEVKLSKHLNCLVQK